MEMSNGRKEQPPPPSSPFPWWCDGHNRPPQSQWLHSTLAELDENISTILELLEDDGDTFGKRAEMYYQKRPQLIKIVKEIHRSYRALADKYDQLHMIKSQPSIKPSTTSSFTKDGLPQQNNGEFIEQFSAADTLYSGLSSSSCEFLSPSSSNKSTNKMGDQTEYYNNNKNDDLMIREKVCIDEPKKFELRNNENLILSNKAKIKENQKSHKGKLKGFFCFSLNNSC